MEKTSFVGACRKFFGQKPGQSLQEFAVEIKQLTDKDREELTALFPSVGYEIEVQPSK